ncbi:hypothetical protein HZX73_000143 [Escherichia coli]|nr:hypothetical protein [Escherichia coli]
MTTLTDKELIKEIKERIGSLDVRDNIERRAYEIALASLEAEPIAWECGENIILFSPDTVEAYAKRAEISPKPLFSAPPALVVPDKLPREYQALLPGGFTIEDAKELYEDLVRSHISKALSGEKMKKKDLDADLRWIHGVIVQAAWFVKASLEALPEPLQEEKGGSANCTASHGTTDNPPVPGKQINELTMLVKRLASSLKSVNKSSKLPDKAMEYLKQNGLVGMEDILR